MHLVCSGVHVFSAVLIYCVFQPLARLGAEVTGIDASPEVIEVAKWHAELDPDIKSRVTYKMSTIEDLCKINTDSETVQRYDGVVASEIVEHVSDAELFVNACCSLVKVVFLIVYNLWIS